MGTSLALAAGELALRLHPDRAREAPVVGLRVAAGPWLPPGPEHSPYLRHDVDPTGSLDVAYEPRPNAELRTVYPAPGRRPYLDAGGAVVARTNASGRRGPDLPTAKPAGTWRLAVVGDSNTFAQGVPEELTYPRRLEALLRERSPAGAHREVLNGGVNGYATRDCAAYLRHRLLAFQPDVVVYGLYLNDVLDGLSVLDVPGFREATGAYLDRFAPAERGWRSLHLVRLVQAARIERAYLALVAALYRGAIQPGSAHWSRCAGGILAMRRDAEEAGAAFVVVVLPHLFRMGDAYPFDPCHETIRAWAEAHDVALLDALPLLRRERAEELWIHPTDVHYNERAHGLVAEALARWLEERPELLAPAPPEAESGGGDG